MQFLSHCEAPLHPSTPSSAPRRHRAKLFVNLDRPRREISSRQTAAQRRRGAAPSVLCPPLHRVLLKQRKEAPGAPALGLESV